MLIDRADNMVNICEMKFSKTEYVVSLAEAKSMVNKAERLSRFLRHKKSINITLVTVNGLAHQGHWNDIHSVVTADDLFQNAPYFG